MTPDRLARVGMEALRACVMELRPEDDPAHVGWKIGQMASEFPRLREDFLFLNDYHRKNEREKATRAARGEIARHIVDETAAVWEWDFENIRCRECPHEAPPPAESRAAYDLGFRVAGAHMPLKVSPDRPG